MASSLKDELLNYLRKAKKDANEKDKGLVSELRHLFYKKKILDTAEFAYKVAGFIDRLFFWMPELHKADPKYVKVQPLCEYCLKLAQHNHHKRQSSRRR